MLLSTNTPNVEMHCTLRVDVPPPQVAEHSLHDPAHHVYTAATAADGDGLAVALLVCVRVHDNDTVSDGVADDTDDSESLALSLGDCDAVADDDSLALALADSLMLRVVDWLRLPVTDADGDVVDDDDHVAKLDDDIDDDIGPLASADDVGDVVSDGDRLWVVDVVRDTVRVDDTVKLVDRDGDPGVEPEGIGVTVDVIDNEGESDVVADTDVVDDCVTVVDTEVPGDPVRVPETEADGDTDDELVIDDVTDSDGVLLGDADTLDDTLDDTLVTADALATVACGGGLALVDTVADNVDDVTLVPFATVPDSVTTVWLPDDGTTIAFTVMTLPTVNCVTDKLTLYVGPVVALPTSDDDDDISSV